MSSSLDLSSLTSISTSSTLVSSNVDASTSTPTSTSASTSTTSPSSTSSSSSSAPISSNSASIAPSVTPSSTRSSVTRSSSSATFSSNSSVSNSHSTATSATRRQSISSGVNFNEASSTSGTSTITAPSSSVSETATESASSSTLSPFSSMSPSTRIGAIVGVSVGVFLVLVLLTLGAIYTHRKKRFRQNAIGNLRDYGYGAVALGDRNSRDRDILDGEGFHEPIDNPTYRDYDEDPFRTNQSVIVHCDTPAQPTLPRLQVRNGMASQVSLSSGSVFREGVWSDARSQPSHSSAIVDPIFEGSRDVDLSGIVEHIMGPRPNTAMTTNSGFISMNSGGGSGTDSRGSRDGGSRMGLLESRPDGAASATPPAYSTLPRVMTPPPPRPPRTIR